MRGWLLLCLVLAGCQNLSTGNEGHLSESLEKGKLTWEEVQRQARSLDLTASREALEEGRRRLVESRRMIDTDQIGARVADARTKLANLQIELTNATLQLKEAQETVDRQVREAMKLKGNAERSYEQVKEDLALNDASFKELHQRLGILRAYYEQKAREVSTAIKETENL